MKVKKMPLLLAVLIITTVFLQVPASAAGATAVNTVGINSGSTYYIMNRHNGQYLSVASNSDSNGTNVCTLDFTQSATQQWRTVLNSDGSYTLYAVSSQSGRVLHYRSSDSNMVIWAHVNNYSPQKFNLIRRTTSSYSGLYQIKNGSLYVSLASSGNNVIATSSATETKTLWSFIPVTKGDADLYAFKYALCTILGITFYYDTTGCANAFTTKCNSLGYSPFFFKNKTAYSAYNNLQNDSIFVFVGHGLENGSGIPISAIGFLNASGNQTGFISAAPYNAENGYYISSLAYNKLNNARVVLYIGCSTGVSYNSNNLVDLTFAKGAHFVLGTKGDVSDITEAKWTKSFFTRAANGYNIKQCIDYANYKASIGNLYYKGDTSAKL